MSDDPSHPLPDSTPDAASAGPEGPEDPHRDRLDAALSDRYAIARELGEGGMATVYLAQDLKHSRKVAIKVLKPELAAVVGAERFLAEIRTTANLQHPHILPLHDSGEADGFLFYVMPFVEGESLRERLERERQLPVEEALAIAGKVASALQYAHEQGVVHRDVKPANILLSRGEPLVADFGIALAVTEAGGGRITETGLSLGTPHYMSPEQAAGERTLDKRSDVYALGSVLYEMLTGQPPFGGSSAQAVLGRILTGDPDPVTTHRRAVPIHVEAAVHRALERLPADRFQSVEAFSRALQDPSFRAESGRGLRSVSSSDRQWKLVAGLTTAVALVSLLLLAGAALREEVPTVLRFSMELPEGQHLRTSQPGPRLDISPDGSLLVYVGTGEGRGPQLFVRPRDALDARPLPGTIGAFTPTFSPDGERIAFGSGSGGIAIVSSGGAPPTSIGAPGVQALGLDWAEDGYIYYVASEGILRVPDTGGTAERVTRVDSTRSEIGHFFPRVLPGAEAILYVSLTAGTEDVFVHIADLETGEVRARLPGFMGVYLPTGHLLTVDDRALLATPFDLDALEVEGTAVSLAEGVPIGTNGTDLAVSETGTLVFRAGEAGGAGVVPVLVDREGSERPVDPSWLGRFEYVAASRTGGRIAVTEVGPEGEHIWVKELGGGPPARVTFEGTVNTRPVFTPDGEEVIWQSGRSGGGSLWRKPADGSRPARLLLDSEDGRDIQAAEVSAGGNWLLSRTNALQSPGADIFARRLMEDGTPEEEAIPLLTTPSREVSPTLSPDGRWIAYVSDESGRDEVYVRPFPDVDEARWLVSDGGGIEPLWSKGGGELFYRRADEFGSLVAVQVRTDPTFSVGEEEPLFPAEGYRSDFNHRAYDVLPGDSLFLMIPLGTEGAGDHLVVVENFFHVVEERTGR